MILCTFLLFCSQMIFAQTPVRKFGDINSGELASTRYEKDTLAGAVVLFDKGHCYLQYSSTRVNFFEVLYERHLRVKIVNQSGFEAANLELLLARDVNVAEEITSLTASTYNLESGKIAETKLDKKSIQEEHTNWNMVRKKITMPAIREGSVFEIKYSIRSPYLNGIRPWSFQCTIPTQYSEYEIKIPQYFKFNQQVSGLYKFDLDETKTEMSTESFMVAVQDNTVNKLVPIHTYLSFTYSSDIRKMVIRDIPAIRAEPFTTTVNNYFQKVEYVYQSIQLPNLPLLSFINTWEEVVEYLLDDENFGPQLNKSGIVKHWAAEINDKAKLPHDKMVLAFSKVQQAMTWNGKFSIYPTTNIRQAFGNREGNSADINMLLLLLLKELELDCNPVVLSTRSNGIVEPYPPDYKKFNNFLAYVKIDGKGFLLDATEKFRTFEQLPFECLNGAGLVVVKGPMEWVKLLGDTRSANFTEATLKIGVDGNMDGSMSFSNSGYPATKVRTDLSGKGREKYTLELVRKLNQWKFGHVEIESLEDLSKVVKTTCTVTTQAPFFSSGQIRFNVMLDQGQQFNPLADPERKYPVDFGCPFKETCMFVFEIPEGFKVDSLPKSMKISLENQGGMFKFVSGITGNKIIISSTVTINQPVFQTGEYKGIREFYAQIVAKHKEQIILSKI